MWGKIGQGACLLAGALLAAVVYDQLEPMIEEKMHAKARGGNS